MLTGQSNFSSVTSRFWPVRIFTQKSSTCNVSQIKPTNIVSLFQSLLDCLKIGLIFFQTDLTPVTRMALISILNAWQTASEWSLAIRTDTCMHWCMFSLEVIKKRLKTLRFTVGDLIVYSRMNNVTVSTWHDWSTWPASEVVKFLASQVTILARHCPLTGHYFESWIFINQTHLTSTSVATVWQKLCVSDWKALNVRGCRRTKLKMCGSKYSMFTIFYIAVYMHNKSNSYQTMFK